MTSAYTPTQISHYLTHISLPPHLHPSSSPSPSSSSPSSSPPSSPTPPSPPLDLPLLTALHTHQLARIPYENLSLHYSPDHQVRLDPQHLYQKLVTGGRGRGGYCMEIAVFFNHVLRGLGFEVYTAGARVRPRVDGVPRGEYLGWVHVVNIVTLRPSGTKYMLDVSYGGDGPTVPLPLIPNLITRSTIGAQELRLIYGPIPEQPSQDQKMWIYQYRNSDKVDWNSCYCFPEFEFTSADFEVMNFYASQSPASFQTWTVLVIRFLRRRDGDGDEGGGKGEVYGKVMMVDGVVKRNLGGKTEVVRVCGSEEERVEALGEYFGISLTEEEREGVRGREVELGKGDGGKNSWL